MKKNVIVILFLVGFAFLALTDNVLAVSCTGSSTPCDEICVPNVLINIVRTVINIIKIGVPIILIVLGMIDMGKAVASQKEDEIKNGQKKLLSRCIAAGITFFVVAIVQLLVGIISSAAESDQNNENSLWSCIEKFVSKGSNSTSISKDPNPNTIEKPQ